MAGFSHAGQSCISVQRILAHESVYEPLKGRIAARVAAYVQPPATVTNGVFGKYAKLVSSASEGAVTR